MILILLSFFLILFLVHQLWYRRLNLPKGPTPLPLIGNVYQFWKLPRWETKFLEWRDEFGPIYTYWFGFTPIITVNDYKIAVEMFIKDGETYSDRGATEALDYATRGGLFGIIESSGGLWREQRRFTLRVLRDFGLAKNLMQDRVLEEVHSLFENIDRDIKSGENEELDFHQYTDIATGSVINSVVNGYRFTTNGKEKEFYRLKKFTEEMMSSFKSIFVNMAAVFPRLSKLPFFRGPFNRLVSVFDEITGFLSTIIDEHEKEQDYDEEFEPRDFIDAYLMEMKRCEQRGDMGYFSKHQLKNVVLDLWVAGQESTSTTLTWVIAYIIRHPKVQKRMQEEMDRLVDSDRLITMSDKINLPYVNATIMEAQRVANILPQNVPRMTTKDVEIAGCMVKKGTLIIPQISVMLIDPNVYEKPREFMPERFIDSNGQLKKAEELIPFSLGKRQCLGEGLARMELFLFIANLFHRYEFLPGKEPPTLEKETRGFSMKTMPYKCKVKRRV